MNNWLILCDSNKHLDQMLEIVDQCEKAQYKVIIKITDMLSEADLDYKPNYIISSWNFPSLTKEVISNQFSELRRIYYLGGDTSYFKHLFDENKVKIVDCRSQNSLSVAEFVFGQILLSNKGYFRSVRKYYKHLWRYGFNLARSYSDSCTGNSECTVGLIGIGNVARKLIPKLKYNSWKIIGYDPYLSDDEARKLGIELVDLKNLFKKSNIVSNHLPDLQTTTNIIDFEYLRLMPLNSTFINTGRGAQISTFAYYKLAFYRTDITVLLDVTRREPLLPFDFIQYLPNVIISPHIAGSNAAEIQRLAMHLINSHNERNTKEIS